MTNNATNEEAILSCIEKAERLLRDNQYATSTHQLEIFKDVSRFLHKAYRVSRKEERYDPPTVVDEFVKRNVPNAIQVREFMLTESPAGSSKTYNATSSQVRTGISASSSSAYTSQIPPTNERRATAPPSFYIGEQSRFRFAVVIFNRYILPEYRCPVCLVWFLNIFLLITRILISLVDTGTNPSFSESRTTRPSSFPADDGIRFFVSQDIMGQLLMALVTLIFVLPLLFRNWG
eukprot:GHVR01150928.1.p1 GENE.GHVR01150928.1~~GHVR01150928.1.p1  ORF type:complete len:234 (+),score=-2.95 GHVR01150928.1:52-753(+)